MSRMHWLVRKALLPLIVSGAALAAGYFGTAGSSQPADGASTVALGNVAPADFIWN